MISAEERVGDEWAEWYRLSPAQRWTETERLWQSYALISMPQFTPFKTLQRKVCMIRPSVLSSASLKVLAWLLTVSSLVSCISPPSDRASVRRVVVANFVEPTIDRFQIGFTAFGNQIVTDDPLPQLAQRLHASARAVAQSRFADVVYLEKPPAPPERRIYLTDLSEVYGGFAKSLAASHQADAVMLILPRRGFPYGVPRHMMTDGLGLYHSGSTAQLEANVDVLILNGQTGRRYGFGVALKPSPKLNLPWKPKLSDYSTSELQYLTSTVVEAFTTRVARTADMQGFKSQPMTNL